MTTMANEMRDRLVELIYEARKEWDVYFNDCLLKGKPRSKTLNEFIADHLIENGVVVPPVKLGSKQKVYIPVGRTTSIFDTKVYGIGVDDEGDLVINPKKYPENVICINGYNLGKTVFLTKEEAEQKLKEMRGE
jgi:hypothetical protein